MNNPWQTALKFSYHMSCMKNDSTELYKMNFNVCINSG